MSPENPKVIYVMGSGRSGSSILGVALGNCDRIFYGGELAKWLWRSGVPFAGSTSESFWQAVREDVDVPANLSGELGRRASCLERSSVLLRVYRWPDRHRLRAGYRRVARELFGAIAKVADASYIVDTSHHPLRAMELQRVAGIDLYLIYLVRDPQGVIASLDPRDRSSYSKSPLAANAHLSLTHLLSLRAFLRHPPDQRMFLRHEDFLADPEGVLRQILDRVGSSAEVPDVSSLRIGRPLMGNRFLKRGSEVVAVKRTTERPARASRLTAMLQFPWEPIFSRLRPAVTPAQSPPH